MVRQAREMVAAGELGDLRVVQVEYPQDWLTTKLEDTGQKQAAWRTDPARSGAAGCVGDIGTHAFNLAEFVTGLHGARRCRRPVDLRAGPRLDDNAQMLLRFAGGARGMLWCSQVRARQRERAAAARLWRARPAWNGRRRTRTSWCFTPHGEPPRLIRRAGAGASAVAAAMPRAFRPGIRKAIWRPSRSCTATSPNRSTARKAGRAPDPASLLVPGIEEGVRGMRFITRRCNPAATARCGSRFEPMSDFFPTGAIPFEGPGSGNALAFRYYDPKRVVLGSSMEDTFRFAVAYWHTLVWPGGDMFGPGTFNRPWQAADTIENAERKAEVAFEFSRSSARRTTASTTSTWRRWARRCAEAARTWTRSPTCSRARCSRRPGCSSCGARRTSSPTPATWPARRPTPIPRCSPALRPRSGMPWRRPTGWAAPTTCCGAAGRAMTPCSTPTSRKELDQLGRFLTLVVEHKHKIGFQGAHPARTQADGTDQASVRPRRGDGLRLPLHGYGLEKEISVNIECNHATLAGHSFEHEVATAVALGIFGSVDANRGDPQNGWDTDQFPN